MSEEAIRLTDASLEDLKLWGIGGALGIIDQLILEIENDKAQALLNVLHIQIEDIGEGLERLINEPETSTE